ncbi:MAG: bifunctional phosphoserine phosphatase/homoserine phosphotransferase ThrH [Arenicella sp.]
MNIICLDLEGVLIPEIWINTAEKAGIEELKATTRDIPDYDELMRFRLDLVAKHDLRIQDIQAVIDTLTPLEGAKAFMDQLRADYQVIILSDTFQQFAVPMMRQLDWPAIFCHELIIDDEGRINDYKLRQQDQKRKAVKAFHDLNFKIVAAGDSYNDTTMLSEAEAGILFCPPQNVIDEFPQYPVAKTYAELRSEIDSAIAVIEQT